MSAKQTDPGKLIHTNKTWRLLAAWDGRSLYFLTFINGVTRSCHVGFLRHENKVYGEFLKFKNLIDNLLNRKIKFVQSENDTEYFNKFDELFEENRIQRRLAIPNNSEQNGVEVSKIELNLSGHRNYNIPNNRGSSTRWKHSLFQWRNRWRYWYGISEIHEDCSSKRGLLKGRTGCLSRYVLETRFTW